MITQVFAQTADTNQIYACVNKTNGEMRMVDSQTTCKNNEKSVKWSIQGPPGPQGPAGDTGGLNEYFGLPFFCYNCYLAHLGDRFAEKDFSYSQIVRSDFSGGDLHEVIFKQAYLWNNNFNDTNLSKADLSEMQQLPNFGFSRNNTFQRANLSQANFSNSIIHEFDFRSSDLDSASFVNATIRGTNFSGAKNLSTVNFSGATFENVTCPDGTNSDNNNSSCDGHF